MASFSTAYIETLDYEGGYSIDKLDKGGETYRGISRKNWPAWKGWVLIDIAKKKPSFPASLDNNELFDLVYDFYKENFWDRHKLSYINNQSIATEIFDTGVNQGATLGVKYLQRSLNLLNRNGQDYPDIIADGICGTKTIILINQHKEQKLVYDLMNTMQGAKYIEICEADKTQERFMHGWLKRTYKN